MDHNQSLDEHLDEQIDLYLRRVDILIRQFSKAALHAGRNHRRLRVVTALGAVVIPIISNLPITVQVSGHSIDTSRIAITAIGLFVALSLALEDVLKFRERWMHLSSVSRFIQKELQFYRQEIGEYAGLDRKTAFQQFVERIESAIADADSALLQVFTQTDKK